MKKILIITLALITLNFAANAQEKKVNKISEVTFSVPDMHGEHCKQEIEKSIPFEKGIKDVIVDIKENTVKIKYDNTKTDVTKIKTAFKKIGHDIEEYDASKPKKCAKSCCSKH
jgi:Copper chaperone